jgi:RNA methyltransferase, TrmH family
VITSTSNERVKLARSLRRREARQTSQAFLLEGSRLLADAVAAGCRPLVAFHTLEFADTPTGAELVAALRSCSGDVLVVSDAVMASMADTVSPQGVLAIAPIPTLTPDPDTPMVLVLDGWQDPGNVGTILRTAEAAGVGWVVLAAGSVDPFSPKVVRAAMGAHLRLPIAFDMDWEAIRVALVGRTVALADAQASVDYDRHDWIRRSALIVGGEARGGTNAARSVASVRVSIPMQPPTESLNAAVAASVILFEAARQRRNGPGAGSSPASKR